MGYIYLAIAIVAEVIGTTALKSSQHFTRLGPSLLVVGGYACSFVCMTRVVDSIPVGIAYAIWAGVGTVLVSLASAVVYRQIPDLPAVAGTALIVAGVVVINVWSKMPVH